MISSCGASVVVLKSERGGNSPLDDVRVRFDNAIRPGGFWNARALGFDVVLVVVVACVVRARCNGDRRVVTVTCCCVERGAEVGWKRLAPDVNGLRNRNSGF